VFTKPCSPGVVALELCNRLEQMPSKGPIEVETTFGTGLFRVHWVRHVEIARSMPDDMNTNDPFKTSEGFAFICVLNFKFPKIFLYIRVRTTCSGAAGPQTPGESGKDSI
jgi:hypothetical protein